MAREPAQGKRDAGSAGSGPLTPRSTPAQITPLFETMRVLGGRVPLLDRHVERLVGSCPRANLLPPPGDLAEHACAHALRPPADRILRLEWNGATLTWDDRDAAPIRRMRLAVVAEPHPGYPIKVTDRDAFDRAAAEAATRHADEPLLLTSDGWVAETARFAVAWIRGDVVRVPSLALEILPSIGRIRVMELAEAQGLRVETGEWRRDELEGCAMFLVNAARGIVPVASLEGTALPRHPHIGALTEGFWS